MLLLVRVDTGRGVVRSALRRRVRGIGRIVDSTAPTCFIELRTYASRGNPRGLLPRLDLGIPRRIKVFVYLLAAQQIARMRRRRVAARGPGRCSQPILRGQVAGGGRTEKPPLL